MSQQTQLGRVATTVATGTDGKTRVTYHNTVVVEFDDTAVTLNSGGWRTVTTKTRMNQAANQFGLGFSVFQKNGNWFVNMPDKWGRMVTVGFYDGITFENRDVLSVK